MASNLRRTSAAALTIGLLLGAFACSSDSDSSSDGATVDTTAPIADGTDSNTADVGDSIDASDPSDSGESGDSGSDTGVDCAADNEAGSDNLSGSAAVLFTADVDTGASDADITPETTLTISADGTTMDPSSLTVEVGQAFGIVIADGGSLDAATIGCSGGQTLLQGVPSGFVITAPGTYPVALDIAGVEVGTVTAE